MLHEWVGEVGNGYGLTVTDTTTQNNAIKVGTVHRSVTMAYLSMKRQSQWEATLDSNSYQIKASCRKGYDAIHIKSPHVHSVNIFSPFHLNINIISFDEHLKRVDARPH